MSHIFKFLATAALASLLFASCNDRKDPVTPEQTGIDLSTKGTANCYIVTTPGIYFFKMVKGNSDEIVGAVDNVEVLWESKGGGEATERTDLIAGISFKDKNLVFTHSGKRGNAVVAAKKGDEILWSWHIWNPGSGTISDQPYYNNKAKMMNVNLGATASEPGNAGALGLLYQWGRKDPFLGAALINEDSFTPVTVPFMNPVDSDSSTGTVVYTIAHPTTFVCKKEGDYNWQYEVDNSLWNSSKSIYDPCPVGYRVPDGGDDGVWASAFGKTTYWQNKSNWIFGDKGMNFAKTDSPLGEGPVIWYPAAGNLSVSYKINDVGVKGYYWSCNSSNSGCYTFSLSDDGKVFPSRVNGGVMGCSLRCMTDEQ